MSYTENEVEEAKKAEIEKEYDRHLELIRIISDPQNNMEKVFSMIMTNQKPTAKMRSLLTDEEKVEIVKMIQGK